MSTATYVVRRGDSLDRIARFFGTTVEAIVSTNLIADPDILFPGQSLIVPLPFDVTPGTILPLAPGRMLPYRDPFGNDDYHGNRHHDKHAERRHDKHHKRHEKYRDEDDAPPAREATFVPDPPPAVQSSISIGPTATLEPRAESPIIAQVESPGYDMEVDSDKRSSDRSFSTDGETGTVIESDLLPRLPHIEDVLVVGIPFRNTSIRIADGLLFVLHSNKSEYRVGETVRMRLMKSNIGSVPLILRYRSSQMVEFLVARDGVEVFRASAGRVYTPMLQEVVLAPGEAQSFLETFIPGEPGSYRVTAWNLAIPRLRLSLDFRVDGGGLS